MPVSSIKDEYSDLIKNLPEDVSGIDIAYHVYIKAMIEHRIATLEPVKMIPHDEVRKHLKKMMAKFDKREHLWKGHIYIEQTDLNYRYKINGTEIRIVDIFDKLIEGLSERTILTMYPDLTSADITAIFAYAAQHFDDDIIFKK